MKSMRTIFSVLICGLLLTSQTLHAEGLPENGAVEMPRWEKNVRSYADRCSAKMDYGAPNAMTGWTELFREPSKSVSKQPGSWKKSGAFFQGALVGLTLATTDTVFGLLNVVSAPVAVLIPIPGGGVSVDQVTGAKPASVTPAGKPASKPA